MPNIRRLTGLVGAVALATTAFAVTASRGSTQTEIPGSQTFSTVGEHTFTVPAGVTSISVEAWGAEGGLGGICTGQDLCFADPAIGGRGAYVSTTIPVTPGEILTVFVGGAGGDGSSLIGGDGGPGFGDGGSGGDSGSVDGGVSAAGGGGGGSSAVARGATALVVAAGGGGGGGEGAPGGADDPISGGVGGDSGAAGGAGYDGSLTCNGGGGGAGTAGAGGAAGAGASGCGSGDGQPGEPGDGPVGGDGGENDPVVSVGAGGGGAGGGWFGGGGGGAGAEGSSFAGAGGGGGGGSSLTAAGLLDDGVRVGDGQVIISWIAAVVAEPRFTG